MQEESGRISVGKGWIWIRRRQLKSERGTHLHPFLPAVSCRQHDSARSEQLASHLSTSQAALMQQAIRRITGESIRRRVLCVVVVVVIGAS